MAVALVLGAYIWVAAGRLQDSPKTNFSDLGELLAARGNSAEVVVVPNIIDVQAAHYASKSISDGMVSAIRQRRINDLLFLAKPGDPRFRLDNYLLRKNLVGDTDYQETLHFPRSIFEEVYVSDELELYRLARSGRAVLAPEPSGWKIARLGEAGEIRLNSGEPAVSDRLGLRIANPRGIRFSLLSVDTFSSPGDGLAVLLYARTEATRTSASLYEVEQDSDSASKTPLQMFRVNQSVPFRRGNGHIWYLDAYLLPVRAGGQYGIYVLTWEVNEQQIADVTCFLFPY